VGQHLLGGEGRDLSREGDVAGCDAWQWTVSLRENPRPRRVTVRAVQIVAAQAGRRTRKDERPDDAGVLDHSGDQVRDTESKQMGSIVPGAVRRRREHDEVWANALAIRRVGQGGRHRKTPR
jgi:hypothetical protein